jgi:hypothetical protein
MRGQIISVFTLHVFYVVVAFSAADRGTVDTRGMCPAVRTGAQIDGATCSIDLGILLRVRYSQLDFTASRPSSRWLCADMACAQWHCRREISSAHDERARSRWGLASCPVAAQRSDQVHTSIHHPVYEVPSAQSPVSNATVKTSSTELPAHQMHVHAFFFHRPTPYTRACGSSPFPPSVLQNETLATQWHCSSPSITGTSPANATYGYGNSRRRRCTTHDSQWRRSVAIAPQMLMYDRTQTCTFVLAIVWRENPSRRRCCFVRGCGAPWQTCAMYHADDTIPFRNMCICVPTISYTLPRHPTNRPTCEKGFARRSAAEPTWIQSVLPSRLSSPPPC